MIYKNKKNYCNNCGKYGHYIKKCNEPVISLGIICFKYNTELKLTTDIILKYMKNKYFEIDNFNYKHLDNISKIDYYKDKIYFLLIQRKHSISYIEFIRGKYDFNNIDKLNNFFLLMSQNEIDNISKLDFDFLWNNLWKTTSKSKIYQKEYEKSKKKFNYIIKKNIIHKLIKIKPKYLTPEWGFPKGRRNYFEKNINCAIREFKEETNMNDNNYIILNNLSCIQENYTGTNNIDYRHIYYIGLSPKLTEINFDLNEDNYEIGNIKWCNWNEAVKLIRPYYSSKLDILNKIFLFSLNLYEESYNSQNICNNKINYFD